MNFARKQLEKYGWKDGDGLGKNSDGITQPIKAYRKSENTGLGYQQAGDTGERWWERVFNDVVDNIEVKKDETGTVSVARKTDEEVEVTNKNYSLKKLKEKNPEMAYGKFFKSATYHSNVGVEEEIPNHVAFEDYEIKAKQRPMTDEEMFKACGGLTAHKLARHGVRLTGKLRRLADQEQRLLQQMKDNPMDKIFNPAAENAWTSVKGKKRTSSEADDGRHPEEQPDELEGILNSAEEYQKKSKKRRKKDRKLEVLLVQKIEESLALSETSKETSKVETSKEEKNLEKKKKKKLVRQNNVVEVVEEPKKSKKRKRREAEVAEKKIVKVKVDSESSSEPDEDIVERINLEQSFVQKKRVKIEPEVLTAFEEAHLVRSLSDGEYSRAEKRSTRSKKKKERKKKKKLAENQLLNEVSLDNIKLP